MNAKPSAQEFDVIVIGLGIGGMIAASAICGVRPADTNKMELKD